MFERLRVRLHGAEQLVARERRTQLALGLERLIEASERRRPTFSAAIPPQREQVRDARTTLKAIARVLLADEPVGVEGVAIVAGLLADGGGPAYAPAPPGALAQLAETALDRLAVPSGASELAVPA
jgi:hypothetical protein